MKHKRLVALSVSVMLGLGITGTTAFAADNTFKIPATSGATGGVFELITETGTQKASIENGYLTFEDPNSDATLTCLETPEGFEKPDAIDIPEDTEEVSLDLTAQLPSFVYITNDKTGVKASGAPAFSLNATMAAQMDGAVLKDTRYPTTKGEKAAARVLYFVYGMPGYEPLDGISDKDAQRAVAYAVSYAYLKEDSPASALALQTSVSESFWENSVLPFVEKAPTIKDHNGRHDKEIPSSFQPIIVGCGGSNAASPMITVPRTGAVNVTVTSARPDWTDANAAYTLEGAVLGVYDDEMHRLDIAVTDANGNAHLDAAGTVKIIRAPEGFTRTLPEDTVKKEDQDLAVTLTPQAAEGSITIKDDNGDPIQNAKVRIAWKKKDAPLPAITVTGVTDKEGIVSIEEDLFGDGEQQLFPLGDLELKITGAPDQYALSDEKVSIPVESDPMGTPAKIDETVKLTHRAGGLALKIISSDSDYFRSLEGAKFTLTSETGQKRNLVTNASGVATVPNGKLPCGTWTLTCDKAPVGYEKPEIDNEQIPVLDPEMVDIGDLNGQLTLNPVTADLILHKPAAGRPFSATSETTGKKWKKTTDKDGVVIFNDLPMDNYLVEEMPYLGSAGQELASLRVAILKSGTIDLGVIENGEAPGLTEDLMPEEAPPEKMPSYKDWKAKQDASKADAATEETSGSWVKADSVSIEAPSESDGAPINPIPPTDVVNVSSTQASPSPAPTTAPSAQPTASATDNSGSWVGTPIGGQTPVPSPTTSPTTQVVPTDSGATGTLASPSPSLSVSPTTLPTPSPSPLPTATATPTPAPKTDDSRGYVPWFMTMAVSGFLMLNMANRKKKRGIWLPRIR